MFTHPITAHLLPLDLLPRHRQLPPQPLKHALTQHSKTAVQFLLIFLLGNGDLPHNFACARGGGDGDGERFAGGEAHVAVFVVVHVNFDGAGQGCGGGGEEVGGAPATVPVGRNERLVGFGSGVAGSECKGKRRVDEGDKLRGVG